MDQELAMEPNVHAFAFYLDAVAVVVPTEKTHQINVSTRFVEELKNNPMGYVTNKMVKFTTYSALLFLNN